MRRIVALLLVAFCLGCKPTEEPVPRIPYPSPDPRLGSCEEVRQRRLGPYVEGDPEYAWYRDTDSDGIVCE